MIILALDPATHTGWATESDYGVIDVTKRSNESDGIKWLKFERYLLDLIIKYNIQLIAYERPGGRHTGAIIHQSKLIAIIERVCAQYNIEYCGYSSSAIKKHATGKGNSNKAQMIASARLLLGYDGDNDNEADAIWLYELCASELNV